MGREEVPIPHGILDSVRTPTTNIAELGEAPAGSDHHRVLFPTPGDPRTAEHIEGRYG